MQKKKHLYVSEMWWQSPVYTIPTVKHVSMMLYGFNVQQAQGSWIYNTKMVGAKFRTTLEVVLS